MVRFKLYNRRQKKKTGGFAPPPLTTDLFYILIVAINRSSQYDFTRMQKFIEVLMICSIADNTIMSNIFSVTG